VSRWSAVVIALAVAGQSLAATVVLKGGKRVDAASYTVSGNYVVVRYAAGRVESYPLAAVDLQATRDANGEKPAAPAPAAKESGPHSPFLAAKASTGPTGLVVTDADVKHEETPAPGDEAKKPEDKDKATETSDDGQLVLLGYDKKKVGDKEWEVTATVVNQSKSPLSKVGATVRILDAEGKLLTTGTGSLAGQLEPGAQGAITTRVTVEGDPTQVAFELAWQKIVATPEPSPAVGKNAPAAPAKPKGPATQAAAPPPPAWSIPKGASPNTIPANVMAPVPPNSAGGVVKAPTAAPKS